MKPTKAGLTSNLPCGLQRPPNFLFPGGVSPRRDKKRPFLGSSWESNYERLKQQSTRDKHVRQHAMSQSVMLLTSGLGPEPCVGLEDHQAISWETGVGDVV